MKLYKHIFLSLTVVLLMSARTLVSWSDGASTTIRAAMGSFIAHESMKAVEHFIKHLNKGVLANVDPFRLEGIDVKKLREVAPTMTAQEIHDYLVKAKEAKKSSKPKSSKDWFYRTIIRNPGSGGTPMLTTEAGDPVRDKNGNIVYLPYIQCTSYLSNECGPQKKIMPFIHALAIPVGIYLGVRGDRAHKAQEKAKRRAQYVQLVDDVARAAKTTASNGTSSPDTGTPPTK